MTVFFHLLLYFRVAPCCDSTESLPLDGILINHCLNHDRLKQCYVNAKDQRHATTAMQYNQLLHECIKHVYVNVTEQ